MTQANAGELGFEWESLRDDDLADMSVVRGMFLTGPGVHTMVGFTGDSPVGDYRIRVGTGRFAARYVRGTDVLFTFLQTLNGVEITAAVKVPPHSTNIRLPLIVSRGDEEATIDISVTDPRVRVSLWLPGGTVVNEENAKEKGVGWKRSKWPPDSGGGGGGYDFGFEFASMLPIPEGIHHMIALEGEARKPGTYVIQVDASASDQTSEVRAMFLPEDAFDTEPAVKAPLQGATRAVASAIEYTYHVEDKVELEIRFEGEPIRDAVQFTSRVTIQEAGSGISPSTLEVPVQFTSVSGVRYRATFTPPRAGVYTIRTTASGTQRSGRAFSTDVSWQFGVLTLGAILTGIQDSVVDANGNPLPNRFDVTASLDVAEPGEYAMAVDLTGRTGRHSSTIVVATLQRGVQRITASFDAKELQKALASSGLYRVKITSLELTGIARQRFYVDTDIGTVRTSTSNVVTDWDPGSFYGAKELTGEPVDLKGAGKFQVYRVRWDVATPGGDCHWSAWLSGHLLVVWGHLASGPATLNFDFDGRWIAEASAPQAWSVTVDSLVCDGRQLPKRYAESYSFKTPVLRPTDFEPMAPDFDFLPLAFTAWDTKLNLQAGGLHRTASMRIVPVGELPEPGTLEVYGVPPDVRTNIRVDPYTGPHLAHVEFFAGYAARPGEYPLRMVAKVAGKQHELVLTLLVEAAAPIPATPPAMPGIGRRAVVVVAGRNAMMSGGTLCDGMKDIVRLLPDGLQEVRDAFGIVEFARSAKIAMPLATQFAAPAHQASDNLARVQCTGSGNSTNALALAREQLNREEFRGSDRIVVLVTTDYPHGIAAKWPIRTQSDSRWIPRDLYRKEVVLPPSGCPDLEGRVYPAADWASGDSMPDRAGTLMVMRPGPFLFGALEPAADMGLVRFSASAPKSSACRLLSTISVSPIEQDIAYLPDTDLAGTPITGRHGLIRFESGPYQGKIRPDLPGNLTNALRNLFENTIQRLKDDGIRVIVLAMSAYAESDFTMPSAPPLDMLLTIHDREQVPAALKSVWTAIGRTKRGD
jgi:hypothetical protein